MKNWLYVFVFLLSFTTPLHAKDLPDFTELVEKQGPAVVNISITQVVHGNNMFPQIPNLSEDDPFFDFFRRFMPPQGGNGGPSQDFESKSLGSGFIISPDGYILTNAHVVDDASEVVVKLTDKREFKAKVIGSDKRTDVALIKINATNLPRVTFGDPAQLKVGEWVAAIGSPFGFENSVTAGIVSAKGRSLPQENYVPFIQTDVAINPGNSGGPLFNLRGEVVGINSQIYSRTGGFMGLSFAIPINVAMDISNQLKISGKVSRGWLGVVIQEVNKELADTFGLSKPMGALIANVEKGSPADKAGLQASDIILKFDGKAVQSSSELPRLVGAVKPGAKVNVQIWRKGALKDLSLVLSELPAEKMAKRTEKSGKSPGKLGLFISELTPEQKQQLQISSGLLVEDAQGPAARAGIRRGDIILAVNNTDVKSIAQFSQIVSQFESRGSVALLVRRGDTSLYVPLKLDGK
ncbi:DegQ family serine endoprotease [Sulfurirhabdus autotrophica]|uniref:Probable periplasmic serine endoprotease DegP-like n=1 Tax=Sulfurirhabdus autotrophica TaxID=1706046 RepID=A0A4R3YDW2_9PROT|nr:DegQ family serine endoprotease [Sulfurirhabdus autotrophica]TCV90220.1 serine protease Do [Sulfurirhabdus autotrophica]